MADRAPLVSVVITSHARPELIGASIGSALAQTVTDREVVVVDNRSARSDEIAAIVARYPGVRLVASPVNSGFPGAVNLGLRAAGGRYLFISEDDVVLPPECLAMLIRFMDQHPDVGIATGRLVELTTGRVLYAGGTVTLGGIFRMRVTDRGEPDRDYAPEPLDVNYAPCGMVLVRRELLERIGPLRDDFFMYYEDTEYCLRALAAGYRVVCLPQLRLLHHASPPTGDVGRVDYHKLKNMRALYLLLAPAHVLPEFFLRYGVIEPLRELFKDPGRWWRMARAWLWVLGHLPMLLKDRRRIGRLRPRPA